MLVSESHERVLIALAHLSRTCPDARALVLRVPLLPVDFLFQSLKRECPYLGNVLDEIERSYAQSRDPRGAIHALGTFVPRDTLDACMEAGFQAYTEKMAASMDRGDVDALLTSLRERSTS
jgi:hypothetical protein